MSHEETVGQSDDDVPVTLLGLSQEEVLGIGHHEQLGERSLETVHVHVFHS